MASREQLHILSKGVLHWNKWREEHPDENIDLSHIDIAAEISERRLRLSFTSALFIPSITKAIQTLIIIITFFLFPKYPLFLICKFFNLLHYSLDNNQVFSLHNPQITFSTNVEKG